MRLEFSEFNSRPKLKEANALA